MKYANTINDFLNVFNPEPLQVNELEEFYYSGTMEVRTGNKYFSPIGNIIEACQLPSERNSTLLMGHRGCGKSTELNNMSEYLRGLGYYVKILDCKRELDLLNLTHMDLMALMGDALVEIADNVGCCLDKKLKEQIIRFWDYEEKTFSETKFNEIAVEAGIEAKTPSFLSVLGLLFKVKTDLKYNEEERRTHRERVKSRSSNWINLLKQLSEMITEKLDGKQPVIIFEELDKIDPKTAWEIFEMYSSTLTEVSFPVIYTFPIALYYSPRFNALKGYFKSEAFPMIKQENIDGSPYETGTQIIERIVLKRAKGSLFEKEALEKMIKKTGGSLRNLFEVILDAARMARRSGFTLITNEHAEIALTRLKSDLTRCIEGKHYPFLAEIYNGNKRQIKDKEMLLEMLQAGTVLEYNGKRWCNLHPLVREFLKEENLTGNSNEC